MRPMGYRERSKLAGRRKTAKALSRAAEMYGVTIRSLLESRQREVTEPRFMVCLAARAAGASYPMIAKTLKKKDHTGILHACRRALDMVDNTPGMRDIFEELYDAAVSGGSELDLIDMGEMSNAESTTDRYEIPLARVRSSLAATGKGSGARREQQETGQNGHQGPVQRIHDPHLVA